MKLPKKLSLPHSPPSIKQVWKKLIEKETRERALEPRRLRILTFSLTFASMALGLSFIPLFPQPLPILLAFMVAAVTYGYPEVGMPIGSGVVGLGLIYQLSAMDFVSMLSDDPYVRGGFVVVWLCLFIIPPIIFHRQKAALAIDLGIIAAVSLFFEGTYFFAIPLILTAGVMFKQKSALTVLYSLLIFVPLLLLQYLKTILQVARTDWWLDPTAVPSVYGPLSGIVGDIQQTSMIQFRLYDTNKIVTAITDQIYGPSPIARLTLLDALKQYRDSLPGILLFLAIVAALVLTVFLIVKTLTGSSMEKVLPVLTATTAALLFFTCLGALQVPLAISGEVNAATAAAAVLTTVLLTLPAALVTYSPKKRATDDMLLAKAKELLARLQIFEENLNAVKNGIPVDVTSVEGKMFIVKDKLNDTYTKALARYYDSSESDRRYEELDKRVSVELEALFSELDVLLREYHTLVNCEYASWVGKLGFVGLKVEPTAKVDFEKDLPIETRIERIKGMLDAGRALANENIPLVEEIYGVVRSLYDPNLPEQSRAVTFAEEKLAEKTAPWVPIDALFVAMNNWRRQYSDEIDKSVGYIRESLGYVAKLEGKSKTLLSAMETGNFDKVMGHVKSAQSIAFGIEENTLKVTEIAVIGNVFQTSLSIATQVLQLFYDELRNKEAVIENLLPKKDYLWEKNITLDARMNLAVETVSNPQKFGLKQTLENLPKFLSYLDEAVATLSAYSERKELLLNYPTAATAIENQLFENDRVFARDLPFEAKHSEEFLKLFYSHRYPEFSFDEENVILAKKP